jgi:hypothetical protein
VSKDRDLRVGKVDHLEIERLRSIEGHDLAVRQPDAEITISIVGDRNDRKLLRDMAKLARARRVLLEESVKYA